MQNECALRLIRYEKSLSPTTQRRMILGQIKTIYHFLRILRVKCAFNHYIRSDPSRLSTLEEHLLHLTNKQEAGSDDNRLADIRAPHVCPLSTTLS